MNPYEDWRFCLIASMLTVMLMLWTGDILGLLFFPMWYYLALSHFDKEYK